jgi:hypothetical protein
MDQIPTEGNENFASHLNRPGSVSIAAPIFILGTLSFEHLPPETLGILLDQIDGRHIFRLLKCGCLNLNRKLLQPRGIRNISLRALNVHRYMAMPHLIERIEGLKSLKIELGKDVNAMPLLNPHSLKSLPKTLESIEFVFDGSERVWICSTDAAHDVNIDPDLPFDFSSYLPLLNTFKMSSHIFGLDEKRTKLASRWRFDDFSISLLPPSLTSLHLPLNDLVTQNGLLKLQTTSLQELAMGWTTFEDYLERNIFSFFFPYLRVLLLPQMNNFNLSFVSALLSSLEHLELPFCWRLKGQEELPKFSHLRHLQISSNVLDSSLIKDLPSSLTHLHLSGFSKVGPQYLGHFPPNLQILCFSLDSSASKVDPRPLSLLPQTLKSFTNIFSTMMVEEIAQLPHTITSLTIWWFESSPEEENSVLSLALLKALPPTLVSLTINCRDNEAVKSLFSSKAPLSVTFSSSSRKREKGPPFSSIEPLSQSSTSSTSSTSSKSSSYSLQKWMKGLPKTLKTLELARRLIVHPFLRLPPILNDRYPQYDGWIDIHLAASGGHIDILNWMKEDESLPWIQFEATPKKTPTAAPTDAWMKALLNEQLSDELCIDVLEWFHHTIGKIDVGSTKIPTHRDGTKFSSMFASWDA